MNWLIVTEYTCRPTNFEGREYIFSGINRHLCGATFFDLSIWFRPCRIFCFFLNFITEFKMVFITEFIQLTVIVVFFGITTCYRDTATSLQGNL